MRFYVNSKKGDRYSVTRRVCARIRAQHTLCGSTDARTGLCVPAVDAFEVFLGEFIGCFFGHGLMQVRDLGLAPHASTGSACHAPKLRVVSVYTNPSA